MPGHSWRSRAILSAHTSSLAFSCHSSHWIPFGTRHLSSFGLRFSARLPANLLGPLCSSSEAFLARLSIARLFSRTQLCVCRSSSSLHDFKLAAKYFLQDSVDVIDSFSWGLSGELQATSMSSGTRLCALVTRMTCGPSCNAVSTRAIVLRSLIYSCLLCAA